MGNVTSSHFSKREIDEDKTFLRLQSSAFFNDTFIASLVEKVPLYGFSEEESNTDLKVDDEKDLRLQKLLSVLSHDPESRLGKVEDIAELAVNDAVSGSGFHAMSAKRGRVLLRMLHVRVYYLIVCVGC